MTPTQELNRVALLARAQAFVGKRWAATHEHRIAEWMCEFAERENTGLLNALKNAHARLTHVGSFSATIQDAAEIIDAALTGHLTKGERK